MRIRVTTLEGLARIMVQDVLAARADPVGFLPKLIFSANGQGISMYHREPDFRASMDRADIVHADGMSLVVAARCQTSTALPERVATSDFFHYAAHVAAEAGFSFYLLGGHEETLHKANERVQKLYPKLELRGMNSGYFTDDEAPGVLRRIRDCHPDVVWVGLGRPKQEAFCVRYREALRGVAWLKTCGGLFSFLAGEKARAPNWVQGIGLEWAHRLILEPRRLFWRYAVTNIHSLYHLACHTRDLKRAGETAKSTQCRRALE
jgi:N-acetylglucosaminyldiphosphoundecaprenol N-acetyl-beta-D-mannosaminyltransferase